MLTVAIYVLTTTDPPVAGPSKGFVFDLGNNVTAATPGYSGPLDCVDPVTGEQQGAPAGAAAAARMLRHHFDTLDSRTHVRLSQYSHHKQ